MFMLEINVRNVWELGRSLCNEELLVLYKSPNNEINKMCWTGYVALMG
jgi:hypothetical protein